MLSRPDDGFEQAPVELRQVVAEPMIRRLDDPELLGLLRALEYPLDGRLRAFTASRGGGYFPDFQVADRNATELIRSRCS
jgi:hypothetical protein